MRTYAPARWRIPALTSAVLVAAVTLALLLLGGQGTASSHSNQMVQGCAMTSGPEYTCFNIYGNGGTTHVDHFLQTRGKTYPSICNYWAVFKVNQYGTVYWTRTSNKHYGCYYSTRVTRNSGTVETNFRNPSTACGIWYENSSRVGMACNDLHS